MDDRPHLDCPDCGEPLFPATIRGCYADDDCEEGGEYIEHDMTCRCGSCDWGWLETFEPTTCDCGARCTVEVSEEDRAYAHLVAVEVPDEVEP